MYISNGRTRFIPMISGRPNAIANVTGSKEYSGINGTVSFFDTPRGVLVYTQINGLPKSEGKCNGGIFGFHIHDGSSCSGNETDEFADAGAHYNPDECPHPYHAGDLPPLFESDGYAFSAFITDRFTIDEIKGKAIIIHDKPDDFTSQPSGNAGKKIACGIISV